MVNKIETTNSEKKAIIDNDEALRLIDLIQQGDSNAENDLAELGSVFIKAVAKQYVDKGLSKEELIAASRYGMLRLPNTSTIRCRRLPGRRFISSVPLLCSVKAMSG